MPTTETRTFSMWDIAHDCDALHIGHRRALDGTCVEDGELLTGAYCTVHGDSRRMLLDQWLKSHGQADHPYASQDWTGWAYRDEDDGEPLDAWIDRITRKSRRRGRGQG